MVVAKLGDVAGGLKILRDELERAGEARFLPRFLLPLGELAACLGKAGEVAQGLATVDEALARCDARNERWYQAELLRIKGELLLQESEHRSVAGAEQYFGKSAALAQNQGALFWELRSTMCLTRARMDQDRRAEAREGLTQVYARFTEGFETLHLKAAKELVGEPGLCHGL
jgi:predicted ATPase